MGRKAKLKKQRRAKQTDPNYLPPQPKSQPKKQDFIRRVEKEGYRFEQIERSPDIPRENIEPEI